jgi:hypothetical protein
MVNHRLVDVHQLTENIRSKFILPQVHLIVYRSIRIEACLVDQKIPFH